MSFNIAIIDYEMGNMKSIYKCLKYLNVNSSITSDPNVILDANGVILPGVGAFGDAIKHLKEKNLLNIIHQIVNEGKPLLGICLGLQLLFATSSEMGNFKGLNLIKGEVILFEAGKVIKVPHIGWNNVDIQNLDHFLVQGIPDKSYFYFVHSFYSVPENEENILGLTKYGDIEFCSIACKDNVIATQFHPEKSSEYGIRIYQNFIDFCKK
ncbi:MAG: imidazole glycerol phosphate synthase subunit HisH [Candidatus Lokiarchaeota archaeon]|nr:imidazole glycerol phosphate synthase subunit HisH [Candidatus Lokiarchaeota archaeon]